MQIIISLVAHFYNERDALFRATRDFYLLDIYILWFGDENLTTEENTTIFTAVQMCVKDTRRITKKPAANLRPA